MNKLKQLLLAALAGIIPFGVGADFYQVNQLFQAGDYKQSFPQLLGLATQGNASAQMTLAKSYAHGYGTEKDYTRAFAWVMLAMDNNHPVAEARYLEYRTKVPSRRDAKAFYKQLKSKYGIETLKTTLFPEVLNPELPLTTSPEVVTAPEPEYPVAVYENKTNIWAIAQYDINENGLTENINILASYPDTGLNDAVNKAIDRWQFKSSYDPQNNPIRHDNQLELFELFPGNGDFANSEAHQQVLTKAKQGSAEHQYLYAKLVETKRTISNNTAANGPTALDWLIKSAVNGFAKAQFELYQCLSIEGHCKADPDKAIKWLKAADSNNERNTRLLLTQAYLTPDNPLVAYAPEKAQSSLETLIKNNDLRALVLYAKLLATSDDPAVKDTQAAIKYARQAMALDNNNPHLLSILGITHYELDKADEGQDFLMQAITEAEYRNWPIDHFVNLLEQYQISTLLPDSKPQEKDLPAQKQHSISPIR